MLPAILLVTVLIGLVLWLTGRRKYAAVLSDVPKGRFRLANMTPAALLVLDLIHYEYLRPAVQTTLGKLTELYGERNNKLNLRIFIAQKYCYVYLAVLIAILIGCTGEIDIASYLLFSGMGVFLAVKIPEMELDDNIKQRRTQIQRDLPDFLNKLTLLVNAGMPLSGAIRRIVEEESGLSPFYKELKFMLAEMNAGYPETQCFENLAKRCRVPEVTMFVSTVIQNIRKGNSELVAILRILSRTCWENRRNTAKRLGEEASTKLLLPMMLIFIAITIIVATPAFITFGSL